MKRFFMFLLLFLLLFLCFGCKKQENPLESMSKIKITLDQQVMDEVEAGKQKVTGK